MKILIVASSSGGHVYPGYKLGKYLSKMGNEVNYLGIENEIDEKIYPKDISLFIDLPKSFKKCINHPIKCLKNYEYLNKLVLNYDVIIGFGGFITYFISILPNIKKRLFYIHEANVIMGDSNYYAGKNAKKIFTSYNLIANKKYKDKIVLTGNPSTYELPLIKENDYITFVFGSLGAKTVLLKTIEYLKTCDNNEHYMLITSNRYYDLAKKELESKTNVKILSHLNSEEIYKNTKLLFSRGGASTLSEAIYTLTNCVCIPSPYVKHHHQEKNACYLFNHHAVSVILEKDYNFIKIKEYIKLYNDTCYASLEKKNQKLLRIDNPCFNIYMEIINDYKK